MNYLEITQHIEQQLVKLLTMTETAKYYVLNHHNKFESTLNAFNQEVKAEKIWTHTHRLILSSTPELAAYYNMIHQLAQHPFIQLTQGDMILYIHTKQLILHEQLLKIKPSTFL